MSKAVFMTTKLVSILVMLFGVIAATLNNNAPIALIIMAGILTVSSVEQI